MDFDYMFHPYRSKRQTMFARNGMVAASQPLAAQAGIDLLKKGGNAIDAAVAAAAALTVTEPASNGIGGDAFALVWTKGQLYGLNASGPSPASISLEAVKERGFEKMPVHGLIPVTVPGAPSAWAALSKRFGRMPLTETLKPAADYAENGYAVPPVLANNWQSAFKRYQEILKGEEYQEWFTIFAPEGKAPKAGEVWKSPNHARTLREIAETNAESFYRGPLAEKITAFSKQHGGFIGLEDLNGYQPEWVEPVRTNYRGYDVWEIPPNGQGLAALMALSIAEGFDFTDRESAERYHLQLEAMKLAYTDGMAYISDPGHMKLPIDVLLSKEYAESRRREISGTALDPSPYEPPKGGTVYLAAADGEGNMVSFIQSNYMGFGSGTVVPGTGIALQNRGADFSLDPSHVNVLKPGKKSFHTIIPGFLTKDGQPIGPFGVMGGYMQPQGHLQVVMNTIDFKLHPQAALDAPRWQWTGGKKILVEPHFPRHMAEELTRKGHDVQISLDRGTFGRGQIIWRDPETGVLAGGTEPRTDGSIAAW